MTAWAIIAAGSTAQAKRYAANRGLGPCLFFSKRDLVADPRGFRRQLQAGGVEVLAVHSGSWKRQRSPQVFQAALALAPVRRRLIVDDESGTEHEVDGRQLWLELSRAPGGLARGLGIAAREVAAFQRTRRTPHRVDRPARERDFRTVLAIWNGLEGNDVGGAATHIAGILGGFRNLGLPVGLVTTEPPPAQLTPLIDELEMVSSPPPGARLTHDLQELATNRLVEEAAMRLARRLRRPLIYQRNRQFLWAGARVAEQASAPLVLEWNNSEVWTRVTYESQRLMTKMLDPLAEAIERYMLQASDLTAAVSAQAAEMALARGADPARVAVVPNGVNVEQIGALAAETNGSRAGLNPIVGWAGAFCQWHGTEVLVRSLALLPPDVRLLLIGDGERRSECERIARELGVSDRVELPGALAHDETMRRLAQCDVLASPHVEIPHQRFFGSPTKLFEYMALGRPIVASRIEQLGELLEDGVTARLVPPGEERELARAIYWILSSRDRGAGLASAARRQATHHTWDQRAGSILAQLRAKPAAQRAPTARGRQLALARR
ncbi:MAG: glycosyltransferase family 4 protein [Solirubrobacterales bacterium]|nr:glycosyltransferase family 4 protein [Solirubrobacterales bacterium]MBV9473844.1 glycosyltransferase family 4 protein [Solirubrobacterales bacterium]